MNAKQLMTSFPLLQGVEEEILDALIAHGKEKNFQRSDILYQHGEEGAWVAFLTHGWVKLSRETAEGEEVILDLLGKGNILGKGLALGERTLPYTVTAVEEGAYLAVPVTRMTEAILKSKVLSLNMLQAMSRQSHRQATEMEHLAIQKAPQRIGCFLLGLAAGHDAENKIQYELPFDKSLLAGKLGMKPETFSRALAQLRQYGVKMEKKQVEIADVASLSAYVCAACSKAFPCEEDTK